MGLMLRFLETREIHRVGRPKSERRINVRVIAAKNRDLEEEVEKKNFREDLFYRLNVVRLKVPPLRDRAADVPPLARHFVEKFSRQYDMGRVEIAPNVFDVLTGYNWPGNVRELRNVIERTMVRLKGSTLTVVDLPNELRRAPIAVAGSDA